MIRWTAVVGMADPLLTGYLAAASEGAAACELERLLETQVMPIASRILDRRLRHISDRQQADDLRHDIQVQLLERLRVLREDPQHDPIADFAGYVATTTHRTCDAQIRRRFPLRSRLKNRIRYALTHADAFRLRCDQSHEWLAGLRKWSSALEPVRSSKVDTLGFATRAWLSVGGDLERIPLARLLTAIFEWSRAPIELDDLVSACARLMRLAEITFTADADSATWHTLADPCASVTRRLEDRDYLHHVWKEIRVLPLRQRIALLLNLRDDCGLCATSLIAATGTATREEIASVLEMPIAELCSLWPTLPLEDAEIAQRLGLSRQQVINLRKSARLRLARRMRGLEAHYEPA